jgi:hypothetical protein
MCQSKANGGRRCNGSSRSAGGSVPTTTSGNVATKERTSAPSREDVDRMARELPDSRRGWDGSPLSKKDRRFFALRESGYKGPIDQDGYADTTSEGAATLRHMATSRGETVDW